MSTPTVTEIRRGTCHAPQPQPANVRRVATLYVQRAHVYATVTR